MSHELRGDALMRTGDRFELRVGLPWIRSLPLWCVLDLEVRLDGRPAQDLRVRVMGDEVVPARLGDARTWWFLQDRLVTTGMLPRDARDEVEVEVSMQLLLPYLHAPGGSAPVLPFRVERRLRLGGTAEANVCRDVG